MSAFTEISPRFMITIYGAFIMQFDTQDIVCLQTHLPSAKPEETKEAESIMFTTARDYGKTWLEKSFNLQQEVATFNHRSEKSEEMAE